jgi:hypothetical protein
MDMKRITIALLLALAALGSVIATPAAWAGSDEATGPDSVQTP